MVQTKRLKHRQISFVPTKPSCFFTAQMPSDLPKKKTISFGDALEILKFGIRQMKELECLDKSETDYPTRLKETVSKLRLASDMFKALGYLSGDEFARSLILNVNKPIRNNNFKNALTLFEEGIRLAQKADEQRDSIGYGDAINKLKQANTNFSLAVTIQFTCGDKSWHVSENGTHFIYELIPAVERAQIKLSGKLRK